MASGFHVLLCAETLVVEVSHFCIPALLGEVVFQNSPVLEAAKVKNPTLQKANKKCFHEFPTFTHFIDVFLEISAQVS